MKIKGNYIKELILKKAMTQQEFADRVDLDRSSLNKMINANKCSILSLKKISQGLEVDPADLVEAITDDDK